MIPTQNPTRYYTFLSAGQQPPLGSRSGHVVVDDRGLRLATKSGGPLSLASTDGSLGRLVLPRGFAIDNRLRCYFVDEDANWLRAFDPAQLPQSSDAPFRKALRLPCPPSRRGRNAWSLAVTRRWLVSESWGTYRSVPTLLTLIVIPVLYYAINHRRIEADAGRSASAGRPAAATS